MLKVNRSHKVARILVKVKQRREEFALVEQNKEPLLVSLSSRNNG